ncbi:hypothetical protein [Carboxylicivirga sp. RSCT41]|uniref:hypothetical protein n=1 Tax=Carboxylicivirga agarovorans TaxID=3417570 RepID=UPI003D32CA16
MVHNGSLSEIIVDCQKQIIQELEKVNFTVADPNNVDEMESAFLYEIPTWIGPETDGEYGYKVIGISKGGNLIIHL